MTDDFLTSQEVASKLRLTVRGVNKMAARGGLPGAFKIGRLWRFDRYQLAGYIKAKQRRPSQWHPSTSAAKSIGAERSAMASSTDGRLERLLGLKL
jgi:excisionase family DNA binding protein